MPKVFIVNDSGHDFSAAKEFGDPVFMSTGQINKFHLTQMQRMFEPLLRDSTPEDYILQSGPTVMCSIACSIYARLHGRLNLLLWKGDAQGVDCYIVRRLILDRDNEGSAEDGSDEAPDLGSAGQQ